MQLLCSKDAELIARKNYYIYFGNADIFISLRSTPKTYLPKMGFI